ncbi:MAG TPA: hypothetical protein VJW51_00375 [Candidatus Acidoferrales bacterium]|nr:hypothetical protein [Candidatus Acidoferrales bacterium]
MQARIRKARTGADAPAKLEQLFLKTRDAMVAFELAKVHEAGQREADAIEWYRKAYERFRRDEWRVKAAEAIQRLGGTPPVPSDTPLGTDTSEHAPETAAESGASAPQDRAGLPERLFHQPEGVPLTHDDLDESSASAEFSSEFDSSAPAEPTDAAQPATGEAAVGGKRRRRGRRGGRRHRKGRTAPLPSGAPAAPIAAEAPVPAPPPRPPIPPPRSEPPQESGWVGPRAEELRTRSGDPGLASRTARLEMQIRRLLACPPQRVSDADVAPAGPGVLLLSDSDLTTHYYICACDTLRIEIGRLSRSDRGSRTRGREQHPPLRGRLAEHLEISESQVAKYMETHCVVRWLQLDEGAAKVAHFAIGVLEPILNE